MAFTVGVLGGLVFGVVLGLVSVLLWELVGE